MDRTLALRPAADLAAAIVVPSHSMSVKTSEEVKKRLEGMLLSPMPDFSRTITVRQLADLLAYLRSLEAKQGQTLRLEAGPSAPTHAILDMAKSLPADLIVMGTHGRSGVDRLVTGSVTEKVLRKASCPVLTVPAPVSEAPAQVPVLFERILCPVDFSDSSMKALTYALSVAQEADAQFAGRPCP